MKTSKLTLVLPEVSAFLRRDQGLYINGRWTHSDSTAKLRIFDPATGQVIAHMVDASASDAGRTSTPCVWRRRCGRRYGRRRPPGVARFRRRIPASGRDQGRVGRVGRS